MTYPCLDTSEAAEFLIPSLLPLCYETTGLMLNPAAVTVPRKDLLCICVTLLQEPVIQFFADSLALVVEFVDVPGARMRYTHDGP